MKIVVIEDNQDLNQIMCKNINKTLINNSYDYDVISFSKYNKSLQKIIFDKEIKIYIIDLELGNKSGYDICREIRDFAYDWDSLIIISSIHNYKEHFISLRLLIFTYLSKLYDFDCNLETAVLDAIQIFENKRLLAINKNCKVSINDIYYILKEKNSKYCLIKTQHQEFRIRRSLKSLQEELHFEKIKNYILINQKNVASKNKNIVTFKNKLKIRIE